MSTYRDETDPRLVERLKTSKDGAWEESLADYRPFLEGCLRQGGTPESKIEDRVQDVLMKLLGSMPTFDVERGSFHAWLSTVIRSILIDYARRAKHRQTAVGGTDFQQSMAEQPAPEFSTEEGNALRDELNRALLDRLLAPVRARMPEAVAVWALCHGDPPMKLDEVARRLNKSIGAVSMSRYRVDQALKKLAADIREHGIPGAVLD